jgi:ligand-binding sensor domain-containing protein
MKVRFVILTIGFCLAGSAANVWAQVRKYSFQQMTEEQGLSQNFVYGLNQDDRGFLWIGTGTGLSRYDGYELKNFSVSDSLSGDFITTDFRTISGNLVFGHNQGGVTLFDGIRFHPLVPDTLGNKVVGIAEDPQGNLWVAMQSRGLIHIANGPTHISMTLPAELQDQIINVLFARSGVLWIGTNEGLFLYRMNGKELTPLKNDVLPPYVSVNSILQHDADSNLIWVGTGFNGIFLLQQQAAPGKIVLHRTFDLPDFSQDVIQSMAQDADGDLWVGTVKSGVFHLNIGRDRKSIFKIDYFRKSSGFPVSSVNKLIVDRQGQIWVSTMGDGVVKIYKELFTYFSFREKYGVGDVRSIAETTDGYLVATDNGLLRIALNLQSDEFEVTVVDELKNESILSVFTDSRKNTWVGSETKGVYLYGGNPKGVKRVFVDPARGPVEVRLFEEDKKGNIWMSARAQGVYVLNPERKVVQHLTTAKRFIHNDVFAIKADSKGNMWFGTYTTGLAMIDQHGALQLFSKQEVLRARDINDIDEDNVGNIWIATEGEGIFKYANGKFTQVGSRESLLSPFIKGIKFDPSGRIWFSYRKGLGYYDLQSEKKYHFTKQDGLLSTEAYSSAVIVDSKFNKWFCNDYGVTLFEHDTLSNNRKALETYLTGIRIFFKDYPTNLRNDNELSSSMVAELPPLELGHAENHITFDFVAIQLNRTRKIYYRHLLAGYDAEWTPPKTVNSITYTNLDPGRYVLKLQATDDLGAWVDPVTEYSFVINKPYWKRTWFYLLQILSVLSLFTLTYLIGKRGIARKKFVVRLMLFSSFFITLEYVENFIDPLVSGFFGGAPVFRFFLNFVLALLLLPVETIITRWLIDNDKNAPSTPPAAAETLHIPDEVLEENEFGTQQK